LALILVQKYWLESFRQPWQTFPSAYLLFNPVVYIFVISVSKI